MLTNLFRRNRLLARKKWGSEISSALLDSLRSYGNEFGFSIAAGDLLLLGGGWFVTHAGLLHLARRNRCHGIEVQPIEHLCDAGASRFAFRATVYKSANSQGFVGCGDADPSNVSPRVRGAEMRVAETRAVNRALRKAYGIGLSSIEELGTHASEGEPPIHASKRPAQSAVRDGHANQNSASLATVPCVRDRLCQIIRQHQLDPDLVKSYAVDFCGTKTLKDATRAQVETFVAHLADWAEKDCNALRCRLNSYLGAKESPEQKGDAA